MHAHASVKHGAGFAIHFRIDGALGQFENASERIRDKKVNASDRCLHFFAQFCCH